MRKNWLVRTNSNQLVGPVSADKLIELIRGGKIRMDDEICSENGHWISMFEKELVEKYLFQSVEQDFNPVSEAEDVLAFNEEGKTELAENTHELEIEKVHGRELSAIDSTSDDITVIQRFAKVDKTKESPAKEHGQKGNMKENKQSQNLPEIELEFEINDKKKK